ncbi:MAG TPA: hypothetical protein VN802_15150 [Stellaceae bacterium]|nr:hypothetical protein [Stellaceae bacterium]
MTLIARPAAALSIDCGTGMVSGQLNTFLQANPGTSVQVTGTCFGNVSVPANTALTATSLGGTEILGQITAQGRNISLFGFLLDGTQFVNTPLVVVPDNTDMTLSSVTIQNASCSNTGTNPQGAILVLNGGVLFMTGGTIIGTNGISGHPCPPIHATGNSFISLSGVAINGNNGGVQVGEIRVVESRANLSGVQILNSDEPAVDAIQSDVRISGGNITGFSNNAAGVTDAPTIALSNSSLTLFSSAVLVGSNRGNVIYAMPGSTVKLAGSSVTSNDATDATILAGAGSALFSIGGNTISNSVTNGTAISLLDASTFRQQNEAVFGSPVAGDAITGNGSIQIESSMELGTGTATPTSWTGNITVAQNSALRMDGGITVTGQVKLTQGSNGFFNVANTGQNIVTGSVLCPFTTNPAAHIAGPAAVLLTMSGASAVATPTATNNCLAF